VDEKYIIDRVEDTYAIVEKENGGMCEIPIDHIKGNFNEGDILIKINEYFQIDKIYTLVRRKQIDDNMKDMWNE
jgi:hypothetical protein